MYGVTFSIFMSWFLFRLYKLISFVALTMHGQQQRLWMVKHFYVTRYILQTKTKSNVRGKLHNSNISMNSCSYQGESSFMGSIKRGSNNSYTWILFYLCLYCLYVLPKCMYAKPKIPLSHIFLIHGINRKIDI